MAADAVLFAMTQQVIVLLLKRLELAFVVLQLCFHCLPLDQQGVASFKRDGWMSHALASAEEKSGPVFWVVMSHPLLEINMSDSQLR
ncbi:hypothetical protein IB69_019150 [Xanthomonas citri]|nr:hypothetical protein RM64_19930 [Xanthomonas phaseoli pv. phaseoli]KHS33232.1 hypothetical protein RN19_22335 [Xanthomonas phaseoli pv. phaseoli]OQP83029.1 hypothetical protein IB69_019150 [Xanthomonas citri]